MVKRYTIRTLLVFILLGLLVFPSHYISKQNAKEIVGDTLKYFRLTKTRIEIEPLKRNRLVWMFKFSCPGSFDEDFYIYTTLLGDVALTNPPDLKNRLRKFEELETHPYSRAQGETKGRPR